MPPSNNAPSKRPALTLAQLSAYDDILTDALVDHVFYWTTIPKNRPSYHASRGVQEDAITKILQQEVVVGKNVAAAEKKLLALEGLRRFSAALKTNQEKEDFQRHLRRYTNMYLPDCAWEVNSTNRYTIVTHEASITARQPIRRNETIKYLSGIQVNITPEEEELISVRKKDFSIVISSRSKSTSLFMGPARFANHDCDANASLMTTSHAGIEIVAVRNIAIGEEITVSYGDNYFGQNNCECLCQSCEENLRNGWADAEGQPVAANGDETKTKMYVLRRRHRDDSMGCSSRTPSATPVMRPKIRRSRTASRMSDKTLPAPLQAPESISQTRKRASHLMATPPITPAKKVRKTAKSENSGSEASRSSSVSDSVSSSHGRPLETIKFSPAPSSEEASVVAAHPLSPKSLEGNTSPEKMASPDPSCITVALEPSTGALDSITVSIESADEAQGVEPEVKSKRTKYHGRVIREQTPPARTRKQGDYVLTPLLLSEPATAWIHCGVCRNAFVQKNAYFTRSSCPRCERHSKLYGYVWPKTDKEGAGDKEERILDHRTVHRFLDHYGEKRARGRKSAAEGEVNRDEEETKAKGRGREKRSITGDSLVGLRGFRTALEEDDGVVRRSGRARKVSRKLTER